LLRVWRTVTWPLELKWPKTDGTQKQIAERLQGISVIIAGFIPGGVRDSSSVISRSWADGRDSGFFQKNAAKLF